MQSKSLGVGLLFTATMAIFSPCTWGQQAIDIQLAPNAPVAIQAIFHARDAVAILGEGRIHSVTGLPQGASQTTLQPAGEEAMGSTIVRLGATVAAYRAAGPDLLLDTADDRLAIVRGLPAAPTIELTSLAFPTVGLTAFSETHAVIVDASAQTFFVLDLAGATTLVQTVFSPATLSADASFSAFGKVSADALLGVGPGPDEQPQTPDDELVLLSGLQSNEGLTVTVQPLPGAPADGFLVTPSGVGVAWNEIGPGAVALFIVREGLGGMSTVQMTVQTMTYPSPSWQVPCEVLPGIGDSVLVRCSDDIGPFSYGNALVGQLSGTPVEIGQWRDDGNQGGNSVLVAEKEIVRYAFMGPTNFIHENIGTLPVVETTIPFAWDTEPAFAKPSAGGLVALTTLPGPQARSLIVSDLQGTVTTFLHTTAGSWWSADQSGRPTILTLSRGVVAGFLDDGSGAVHSLRLLSVPTIGRVGLAKTNGPADLDLVITPTVPGAMIPLTHSLTAFTPAPALMWLLVSAQSELTPAPLGGPLFGTGSMLHVNLQTLVPPVPVPVTGNFGLITLDPGPVAGALLGLEWHVQAVCYDAVDAQYSTSDAFLIVVN